mmetsp:Transcript_86686/g.245814  ORF Transcript_86686/g.245814 Transcript_86686/m.245814 type:complete len:262 (-) Transcript_86686:401-1186(-)
MRYGMNPPGAIVNSKAVSMERSQVPKRSQRYLRTSMSRSVSMIVGRMTWAKKIAAIISSKKRSVIDHSSAPTDEATALTSTRRGLKIVMTRTTRNTFDSFTSRMVRRTATCSTPMFPSGLNTHASSTDTNTISASTVFATVPKYLMPATEIRRVSSTKNAAAKRCSSTYRVAVIAGTSAPHPPASQSPNTCTWLSQPLYSISSAITMTFSTMSRPAAKSNFEDSTNFANRELASTLCLVLPETLCWVATMTSYADNGCGSF